MNINLTQLKQDLIRDEGRRFFPYEDTRGNVSIGIGRNLTGRGLLADEINYLYNNDARDHLGDLKRLLPWTDSLDEVRARALANMCFNLGIIKLLRFKDMLNALKKGDWPAAAKESLDSLWADESDGTRDGKAGTRARRIAYMFEHGQDAPF